MPNRKNEPYKDGELEIILSLAPMADNIKRLGGLLERSEKAIETVYKQAFEYIAFSRHASGVQQRKVIEAKKRLGIRIGPRRPHKATLPVEPAASM